MVDGSIVENQGEGITSRGNVRLSDRFPPDRFESRLVGRSSLRQGGKWLLGYSMEVGGWR